ncbi:MAG: hypothetical protein HND58_01150 [Planctomycetota bacterium]|nr:MAG: hypothetical protein HND58_01150 [Planctomycetota bacterium]
MRTITTIAIAGLAATTASAQFQFFSSADAVLYRGTDGGLTDTFNGADEIRGMSILENGVNIAGASFGDVIAVSSPQGQNDAQEVYRVDNAFSGTPSLVQIGVTSEPVSDIAFANGRIFGVDNSGPAGTILVREFDANFNEINTFDTGINIVDRGAGGLAYDPANDIFYVTDPDSDQLWSYSLGGSSTLLGNAGFDFGQNDLAMFNGKLYAAIAELGRGTYNIGEFNTTDGSFFNLVTVGAYPGGSIGAVVIPATPTLALLGLGGLAAARRRR